MTARSSCGSEAGEDPASARTSPVDDSKPQHVDQSVSERTTELVEPTSSSQVPGPPPEDSVDTPKISVSRAPPAVRTTSTEDTATDSPSSEMTQGPQSADASPQPPALPVVSHVPASVQQPVLPQSAMSSLASSTPPVGVRMDGDGSATQAQQQTLESKPAVTGGPPITVIHGTQGQVVAKQKGRFRLLQDGPIMEQDSESTETNVIGKDGPVHEGVPAVATTTVVGPSGAEVGSTITHPTRERSLSNTSTLSAMSGGAAAQMSVAAQSAVATTDHQGNQPVGSAPAVKKKGRFVVTPGDVLDPALLGRAARDKVLVRQITPTGQPLAVPEGVPVPQVLPVQQQVQPGPVVADPSLASHHVQGIAPMHPVTTPDQGQQVQHTNGSGAPQRYQGAAPQEHTQMPPPPSVVGSVQHQVVQPVNPPQFYVPAPPVQAGAQFVVLQSLPQQQRQQQPIAIQTQVPTTYSNVPQSQASQPGSIAHQPPAQVLVSTALPQQQPLQQPPHMQTEVVKLQQAAVGTQPLAPSVDSSGASGMVQQAAMHPPETQVPLHPHAGQALPQTEMGADAAKLPPASKAAAAKRPSTVQRHVSGKGLPTAPGFGKVLYFLDQMKLEVTDADKKSKEQARDMKFLREKNKELEAKSRDMEKRWLEERSAREALEAKVKSLKKKVKELKGSAEAVGVENVKEVGAKMSEADDPSRQSQSRSNSLDGADAATETAAGGAAPEPQTVDGKVIPTAEQQEEPKPHSEAKESRISKPPESTKSEIVADSMASAQRKSGSPAAGAHKLAPPSASLAKEPKGSLTPPSKSKAALQAAPATLSGNIRRSSSVDQIGDEKSLPPSKATYVGAVQGKRNGSSSTSCIPKETMSPPRRRASGEIKTDKLTIEQSSKVHPGSFTPQTSQQQGGGLVNVKPLAASSGDSLGSGSEFDPLRGGPHHVGQGQAPTSSEVPLPQQIDFDPLRVSHDRASHDECTRTVMAEMPMSQSVPQHSQHVQSQSMPNFVLYQNTMSMAHPVQQGDGQMAVGQMLPQQMHQSWNQYQQSTIPAQQTQYMQAQYPVMNAGVSHQQPHQHQPSTAPFQQQTADPFDELASRRARGNA